MTTENTLSFVYDSCKSRIESLTELRKKLLKSYIQLEGFIITDENKLISHVPNTIMNSLINLDELDKKLGEEIAELKKIKKVIKLKLN